MVSPQKNDSMMETEALFQYLFSKSELAFPILLNWMRSSMAFKDFVESNKNKIRGKITDTQKDPRPDERLEKLKDVQFEIEVAYLMLKSGRFSVEYEHYGKTGPDFTVTDKAGECFNVEVKRIRATDSLQMRFDVWKDYVRNQTSNIQSNLAMYFQFANELDNPIEFVNRLEDNTQEIINFIKGTVFDAEKEIIGEGKQIFTILVPKFEEKFLLRFRKSPYLSSTLVSDGGEYPSFKTSEEYLKFDKLYWKVLKNQVISGMINLLVINTDSKSHDSWSLRICMYYLGELARRNVIEKTKLLSGVLFRGAWIPINSTPNILWEDTEAFKPIPVEIGQALMEMN